MVYSSYKKTRILSLAQKGYKSTTIKVLLEKEGLQSTARGIQYFIKKYKTTGIIAKEQ